MENPVIKYGLILGAALAVVLIGTSMVGSRFYFGGGTTMCITFLYLLFMYKSAVDTRTENGNVLSFGAAFKSALITGMIGAIIGIIAAYIAYNFVNTGLAPAEVEMSEVYFQTILDFFSESADEDTYSKLEDIIDDTISQIQESGLVFNMNRIVSEIMNKIFSCAIGALIIGLFTKRSPVESV